MMSELSKAEISVGKATMYVISEKGVEVGPFVYRKKTENRILCTSTGHLYLRRKPKGTSQSSVKHGSGTEMKLRIVDLSSALPGDNLESPKTKNRATMEMENSGLLSGDCRANALSSDWGREKNMHEIIKETETNENNPDFAGKRTHGCNNGDILQKQVIFEIEDHKSKTQRLSLSYLKDSKLKELGNSKKDALALEINKLRERRLNQNLKCKDEGAEPKPQKTEEFEHFKRVVFFSAGYEKNNSEGSGKPQQLTLPAVKTSNPTGRGKSREKLSLKTLKIPPKETKHLAKQPSSDSLIFVSPRSQYCPVKAESTAKQNMKTNKEMNISETKVRLPVVIDQRTGQMHSVPGAVALQLHDYNRWSRKRNFIRRNRLKTVAPSKTFVNVLPPISEG